MKVTTPEDEYDALIAIKDAMSDYFMGLDIPEFAIKNGGTLALYGSMVMALEYWEREFNTIEEEDD